LLKTLAYEQAKNSIFEACGPTARVILVFQDSRFETSLKS